MKQRRIMGIVVFTINNLDLVRVEKIVVFLRHTFFDPEVIAGMGKATGKADTMLSKATEINCPVTLNKTGDLMM